MPLNLSVSDGEFTPYLKYNAKAGRFYVRPEGQSQDVEVMNPRLLFDMANIKTGWLYYAEGTGPEKVWDPSPTQMAPKPAGPKKFKRGFEVLVFGADQIQGIGKLGLREFSSTASNVITSILRMYAEYEAGMKANPNKIPFFRCERVQAINGVYGTNYEPEFKLIGWVERSKVPALEEHGEKAVSDDPFATTDYVAPTPAERSNGHVAPAAAPQRANDLDDAIPW